MTKYDDADWHEGAALEAGQPAEHAFAHIGLYLGWLIRHDLVNTDMFAEQDLADIKVGTMTGADLHGGVDGKLFSELMTQEGAAFSDWYYRRYVEDYDAAFDGPDYSIADEAASRARIDPVIDRSYSDWIAAGRPSLRQHDKPDNVPSQPPAQVRYEIVVPDLDSMDLDPERRAAAEAFLDWHRRRGDVLVAAPSLPHVSPELEALIPVEIAAGGLRVCSQKASDPRFRRALKAVVVSPKEATTAWAVGRAYPDRPGAISVELIAVPGVAASRLDQAFESAFRLPKKVEEILGEQTVAGRQVHKARAEMWVSAWWTLDDLVIHCSAPDESLFEILVSKLPG